MGCVAYQCGRDVWRLVFSVVSRKDICASQSALLTLLYYVGTFISVGFCCSVRRSVCCCEPLVMDLLGQDSRISKLG